MRKAILTCPNCGHKQSMAIPVGKCIPFYKCNKCKKMITAKKECCVICEYSSSRCPVSTKRKKRR